MATGNCINLSGSGIASYNGSGTFTALANPLTVSNGGFGVSSNTTYAVLCGGTTGTGAVQNVSGVGSSGQVLTSNGAASLPTWQTASGSAQIVWFIGSSSLGPSDSTTYWFANVFGSAGTTSGSGFASTRYYVPTAGTIRAFYGVFTMGAAGTSESVTVRIIINGSTNVDVTTTLNMSSSPASVTNAGLSQAVSAGDYIQLVWITPAWVTNPSAVRFSGSMYIS